MIVRVNKLLVMVLVIFIGYAATYRSVFYESLYVSLIPEYGHIVSYPQYDQNGRAFIDPRMAGGFTANFPAPYKQLNWAFEMSKVMIPILTIVSFLFFIASLFKINSWLKVGWAIGQFAFYGFVVFAYISFIYVFD